jgi:hypothetical protein
VLHDPGPLGLVRFVGELEKQVLLLLLGKLYKTNKKTAHNVNNLSLARKEKQD